MDHRSFHLDRTEKMNRKDLVDALTRKQELLYELDGINAEIDELLLGFLKAHPEEASQFLDRPRLEAYIRDTW